MSLSPTTTHRSHKWQLLAHICLIAGFVCTGLGTSRADEAKPTKNTKPNIVVIIGDDQAWSDYGFMGHPQIKTPHLDQLAEESLVFKRGYVPSSLCCPSLASIITGLYPHQHFVTSNDPPIPPGMTNAQFYQSPEFQAGRATMNRRMESLPTLARELVKQDYLALQTGKWWQGHYRHGGFTHGMTQGGRHGDEGLEIGRKTMQPIYDFMAEAKQNEKPFFVWYAPLLPHDPHTPPERLLAKYRDKTPSIHVARYWAMVEWFDETCGQLLTHLDEEKLAENTIVVYLADNGWIQDPTQAKYAPRSKQSPYDGGIRTPIIIRWPEKIKPQDSPALATSLDLMPTLLTAVGLKPTAEMRGINLLDKEKLNERDTIFGECFTHNSKDLANPAASLRWRWMIQKDWKLIVPDPANEPNDVMQLYNLKDDPLEKANLIADPALASQLAEMKQRFTEFQSQAK